MVLCIKMGGYDLLLSYKSEDLFDYYSVDELHGLTRTACQAHNETEDGAYIAGLCNVDPHNHDKKFIYINLTRCQEDVSTALLIMHETMHMSSYRYDGCWDSHEEDMISWAELEARIIFDFIKPLRHKAVKTALSVEKEQL
jgi:hypothetical protein